MTTTALYSGQIEVCISYAGVTFSGAPQIFHFVNGAWVNSTTTVDSANKIVCGVVTSLSPFALFASADQPPADQPPVAQAGAGQTIEATSAAGALVSLNGSGSDPDGDPLTFTWSEGASPLGTGTSIAVLLPIGVHTIALTADDGRGGTGASTVQVVIRDTTPPVLALPAGQTLEATGASGAVASFSASATDSVDGLRPVSCVPSSGSTFALGTTTVTCSASDTRGNTSSGGFAIVVRDTTPPIVTAPANITVAATESGGARGSASASLASFLTGGTGSRCGRSCGVAAASAGRRGERRQHHTVSDRHQHCDLPFPRCQRQYRVGVRDGDRDGGCHVGQAEHLGRGDRPRRAQWRAVLRGRSVHQHRDRTGESCSRGFADGAPGEGQRASRAGVTDAAGQPGNLDAGASQTVRVVLKLSGNVREILVGELGTFFNAKGIPDLFIQEQTVTP